MAHSGQMTAAYDNALLGILQNEEGLEAFLDVIFGFLSRRTDFFLTMKTEKQKFGFPPGIAQKMVLQYFNKYRSEVLKIEAKKEAQLKENAEKEKEESKMASVSDIKGEDQQRADNDESNASVSDADELPSQTNDNKDVAKVSPNESSVKSGNNSTGLTAAETEDIQSYFQKNPDSYNGAMRENYQWSQNYDDVDVKVPVVETVKRGKQVYVDIQRKHLTVKVKTTESDPEFKTIIDDEIQHEINKEDSMWSLEGGKEISINLTKDKNIWWTTLLKSEEEIDIQKICPERSMADMDEEEKAVINKLQFDDHQKKLGLPQSHEMKVHEMLKKGWDAEGSPFKGQEFDPKMFNISSGAVDM